MLRLVNSRIPSHSLDTGDLKESQAQVLDSIKVTECTGGNLESGAYHLEDVQLDVQAYQLRGSMELESSQHTMRENEEEAVPQARVIALPNKELDGIWES